MFKLPIVPPIQSVRLYPSLVLSIKRSFNLFPCAFPLEKSICSLNEIQQLAMEGPPRTLHCRICLGSLEFPRNLAQPNYKHLKQILNQILGYEIPTKGGMFNICFNCENKLIWILEFKELCDKSLNTIEDIELKKELSESEEDNLSLPEIDNDNDVDYTPEVDLATNGAAVKAPTRRKRESKTSAKSAEKGGKLSKSLANVKLRRTKYKQYSANVVMQAISECSNYITDAKTRTCIYCSFEGTTSTVLSVHMYKNHSEVTINWCNRCNVQTDNLEMHRIATQCAENRCKFCSKKCKNINKLGEHLKLHCHSFFKEPDGSKKYIIKPELEAPTMIWFKEDPFEENTDFIDTLKEGIKGANEKVLKRQLQRISSASMSVKNSTRQDSDNENGETVPTKQRKCRFQQFPYREVEKAIKDTMRSYHMNRKCIVCGTKTRNGQVLSVHMTRMHKETRDRWCLKCNKMYDNLEEHSTEHKLECVFCQQAFFNLAHLKTHLKAHSRYKGGKLDSNWICCKHCQSAFPTKEEMKDHNCKRTRSKDKITSAKLIVKDENSEEESDSDDEPLIRCYNKVKSRYKQFPAEQVQAAIYETMKAFRDNRKCIVCGHLATQLRSLSLHMSQVHKDVINKWCSRCNTFSEKIKEHKESHRNDLLKCKFCEKRYTKTLDVRLHLKFHAQSAKLDTELKWFSCKKCPKSYQTERELKDHDCEVAGTVGDENIIKLKTCRVCGKQFPNLRIHMKQVHWVKKGPKQRLCPICGKVFVRNYELTVHVRTHTGEKPFKCSYCEKQFNIRRSLQVHERRHVGEKRHICHICAKAFVTSAELKTHSRIHETGSVSEQCLICDKKFYRSGVLQAHMKKHRGFQTTPRPAAGTFGAAAVVNTVQQVAPPPQAQMEVKQSTDPIQMFFADIC